MLTAKTSQSRGDRKFVQSARWLGYGKSQKASQGRPTWMRGKIPAHMTAKIVMASAKRAMALRQRLRKRKRIAEMSVPAWPIPTQKTKLMMSKAQKTGLLFPHTPMPV